MDGPSLNLNLSKTIAADARTYKLDVVSGAN